MEILIGELQDTKSKLTEVTNSLIEVQTALKIFIENQRKTETSITALDSDVKEKFNGIYTRMENHNATINNWKGAINILSFGCVLMPVLIMGVFTMFNPNNARLEKLQTEFHQHVYDPKLHYNTPNYLETNFAKKYESHQ